MNQIINMIIRQVMGQLINRGVRAGFDQAGKMGQRRKGQQVDRTDELGNEIQPQMTREERQERRRQRQARQQNRQAQQAMKATNRISKF